MPLCDKCHKSVDADEGQTVRIRTARQTRMEPAEYDELFWCHSCIERDAEDAEREYEGDV